MLLCTVLVALLPILARMSASILGSEENERPYAGGGGFLREDEAVDEAVDEASDALLLRCLSLSRLVVSISSFD